MHLSLSIITIPSLRLVMAAVGPDILADRFCAVIAGDGEIVCELTGFATRALAGVEVECKLFSHFFYFLAYSYFKFT